MNKISIGCVADDFSGASDAASFLVKSGLPTYLFNGVPEENIALEENAAVVVALKTRTEEKDMAVKESMEAFDWLNSQGAEILYSKYCSTFDSTKEGNIGPIIDAVLEKYNYPSTVLCPALPVNGRVVKGGNLFINGVPLHETHMKDHPLTPMWDSDLSELIKPQGKYKAFKLDYEIMKNDKSKAKSFLDELKSENDHFYVIPDYIEDNDGKDIVELFDDMKFMTGGSGLLYHLGNQFSKESKGKIVPSMKTTGKAILLAGSCSKATLEQITDYQEKGHKSYKIDPEAMLDGKVQKEDVWNWVLENNDDSVLIYSSDNPENVNRAQKHGKEKVSQMLEDTTAYLAKKAFDNEFTRIIVAGGETSGAVTKTLGFAGYQIGESIAPGVPVMVPLSDQTVRLVLKSGNFGQKDFFELAVSLTGDE
ncbi:3-oxo-tetronate kinase [Alkalibacter mobilis]|uniref:3-oxo-tetronate kinase n=1 Tax=Alkalibacter mobilis TaxID=2787712 RepID=UPI001A9B6DB5|nr:3-oxo-tetronate kinase [Alkalibacter mobilis]